MLMDDFSGQLQDYSLVILHQLPSFSPRSPGLFKRLSRIKVPLLFILGEQTDLQAFNAVRTGIQLNAFNSSGMNEVQAALNDAFTTFNISSEIADIIPFLPPLNTRFARYNTSNSARTLFFQKIGNIESHDPLWILQSGRDIKTAVIAGTGIWKWRMKSWLLTGDHQLFQSQ